MIAWSVRKGHVTFVFSTLGKVKCIEKPTDKVKNSSVLSWEGLIHRAHAENSFQFTFLVPVTPSLSKCSWNRERPRSSASLTFSLCHPDKLQS